MDWQTIILPIVSLVLTALASWGVERLVAYINEKLKDTKSAKYLNGAISVVASAVKTTYQTYVESLKHENAFTKEAQVEALNKAKEMAIMQLSASTQDYIKTNFGDINVWLQTAIEAAIYDLKNKAKGEETQ